MAAPARVVSGPPRPVSHPSPALASIVVQVILAAADSIQAG
jgi:hypothetical protein